MSAAVVDQLGREIVAPPPQKQRIISLVPSQTELLIDLGVNVVGRTRFCVHPQAAVTSIAIVGGTKQINLAQIDALSSNLIIANKEENEREAIEQLAGRYPVWISDVRSLEDALAMIRLVGQLVGRAERAREMALTIEQRFATVAAVARPLRVAYLIWRDPWMVVSGDTFIDDMLRRCGFVNVFGTRRDSRYPAVSDEEIVAATPDVLLLSTEPFPFGRRRYQDEVQQRFPNCAAVVVDGELFSWYGSRLLQSAVYLNELQQRLAAPLSPSLYR